MRNIRLILEYDGTRFFGWQRQADVRTVQGEVEAAVERLFQVATAVAGAGRTDRGVHALGYVCNFKVDTALDTDRIHSALLFHLPDDVVVTRVDEVPMAFHSRFDATARRYMYRFTTAPTAIMRHVYQPSRYPLDVGAMNRAATALVGEHDFTSFTPAINDISPLCVVSRADVRRDGPLVTITVEANRFLHNMVRIMAGTLLEIGRGRFGPERMGVVLRKRDRTEAGPTAPPRGLVLVGVRYPDTPGEQGLECPAAAPPAAGAPPAADGAPPPEVR